MSIKICVSMLLTVAQSAWPSLFLSFPIPLLLICFLAGFPHFTWTAAKPKTQSYAYAYLPVVNFSTFISSISLFPCPPPKGLCLLTFVASLLFTDTQCHCSLFWLFYFRISIIITIFWMPLTYTTVLLCPKNFPQLQPLTILKWFPFINVSFFFAFMAVLSLCAMLSCMAD